MIKFKGLCATTAFLLCGCVANANTVTSVPQKPDTETSMGVVGLLEFDFTTPLPLFNADETEPFDYIICTPRNFENGVFYELSRQSGAPLRPDYIRHGAQAAAMADFYDKLPEKDTWTRSHFVPGIPYALAFRSIGEPQNGRTKIVIDQDTWETAAITFDPQVMEFRPWESFLKNADEVSFTSLTVYDKPNGHEVMLDNKLKHGRPGEIAGNWLAVHCWDGQHEQMYWVQWKDERGLRLDKITVFVR